MTSPVRTHGPFQDTQVSFSWSQVSFWLIQVEGGFNWSPAVTTDKHTCVISDLNSVFLLPGNHHHDYQHSHLDLSALTPMLGKNARRASAELAQS